jgi:hypothetical protein
MFVVPNEEEVKMMFEISAHIKGELLTSFGKDIKEQLEELNLECNKEGSTNYKWSTTCNDIESALSLFRKFFGSKE